MLIHKILFMKRLLIITCLFLSIMLLYSCSTDGRAKVVVVTDYGNIELQLYDKTSEHSANFIKLCKEGFYDGLLFHRVAMECIIESGDPDSKDAVSGAYLGKGLDYTIQAEIFPEYIHKRGAVAAGRLPDKDNPEKTSSGSLFYIVQGKIYTDYELDLVEVQVAEGNARNKYYQYFKEEEEAMHDGGETVDIDSVERRASRRASAWLLENPHRIRAEAREVYKTIGGFPIQDGEYTVFGKVIKGIEVIDKIAEFETDDADRPKVDVRIIKVKVK